jgi:transposase
MAFTFQGRSSVSLRWQSSGRPSTSKMTENSRTHPQRPSPNNPWAGKHWTCVILLLHHDNTHAHASLKTTGFMTNNMVIVPLPPYSPDLDSVISLFPKLKMKLKGWCFETVSDIQTESQAVFESMGNDLHSALQAWQKWWDVCIRSQGDYFERDGRKN